jgi:hypothetical protein
MNLKDMFVKSSLDMLNWLKRGVGGIENLLLFIHKIDILFAELACHSMS